MRKWLLGSVGGGTLLAVCTVLGQTKAPPVPAKAPAPEFEVANITPAAQLTPDLFRSGKVHIGMTVDGARVDIGGLPLMTLLPQAFRVKQFQIVAPDWTREARWDILAKIPDGASQDQVPEMLQALLADRFKMTVHREMRELPVYALIVGKDGVKMKEAEPDPNAPKDAAAAGQLNSGFGFFPGGAGGQARVTRDDRGGGSAVINSPQFGTMKISGSPQEGRLHLEASEVSMPGLADMLTGMTDRPVLDMTELKGNYQVTLDISMQEMMAGMARTQGGAFFGGGGRGGFDGGGRGGGGSAFQAPADSASDPAGNAIFGEVEKLGLKLDARKAPVETIVVDHIEKTPTDN